MRPHFLGGKSRQWMIPAAFLLPVSAMILYLMYVAWQLRIESYDGYHVLLNARHSANLSGGAAYAGIRGAALSFLYAPVFLAEKLFLQPFAAFRLAHVQAVGIFVLLLWVIYRFFRLGLSRPAAVFGMFLFAMNPLIIHIAPFVKEDIPGALMTVLVFHFYMRQTRNHSARYRFLCGLCIAGASLSRYNLTPLFVPVLFAEEILSGRIKKNPAEKIFFFLLMPAALFIALPSILYAMIGRSSLGGAPQAFFSDLLRNYRNNVFGEKGWQNFIFIGMSFGWPVLALVFLGMASGFRRGSAVIRLAGLWVFVFFVFHTCVIDHKESRLLFSLFPGLYFFAALGVERIAVYLSKRKDAYLRVGAALLVALAIAMPLRSAVAECLKFRDPVYRSEFQWDVCRLADRWAGKNRVFWMGNFYSIFPKEHLFHWNDEFTYFYHMYAQVIEFITGRPQLAAVDLRFVPVTRQDPPVYFVWSAGQIVGDGDVMIVNPDPKVYQARILPKKAGALQVSRVRRFDFQLDTTAGKDAVEMRCAQDPAMRMSLSAVPGGGTRIAMQGVKPGSYDVAVKFSFKDYAMSVGVLSIQNDEVDFSMERFTPAQIDGVSLITYDKVQSLSFGRGGPAAGPYQEQ